MSTDNLPPQILLPETCIIQFAGEGRGDHALSKFVIPHRAVCTAIQGRVCHRVTEDGDAREEILIFKCLLTVSTGVFAKSLDLQLSFVLSL